MMEGAWNEWWVSRLLPLDVVHATRNSYAIRWGKFGLNGGG